MTPEQIADAIRYIVEHAILAHCRSQSEVLLRDLESLNELADTIHKE